MKSKFLAIVVATAIMLCTFTIGAFADVDVSSGYSSVSTHKSQMYPINNSTLVTFGDSVTAFAGWQDEIEALGATVVNTGTGGMTVINSMQSFGTKVMQYNPDFATIMFGFNDGNKGKSTGNGIEAVKKEKFKAYYQEFVRLCRENDIIPIIITQHTCVESIWYSDAKYPGTESFYEETNGVAGWFDSYADVAREVAAEMDVNLIDWNAYSKTLNETDIIGSDGVHLSDVGKDALGVLVSDYLSANYAGDAAAAEKISYPKPNTVLIEDFNSSTDVPESFTKNGKTASTLTVTDEMSAGNNALKNVGAEWSGPKHSFDAIPENCIGLRFKMYTSAPSYSIWAFDSATNINSRIYDVRYITNYVYDAFVPYNFYFDDYAVKKGSVSDIISFTIMAQAGKNVYFDDFEWIVEGSDTPSIITMTSGAAMRIDGATDGIRFTAAVDKDAFDNAVSGGTVTEIGTLIAKEGTALDNVVVENAVEITDNSTTLEDGKIPVAKYAQGTTMSAIEEAGVYTIVGSLVEIKDVNANVKYVARAYVKYTVGNAEYVLYADALSEARSIAQVANSIKTAADGYYDSLCESHKSVVDKWADKYSA